jgi:hypothetical protein
MPLGNQEAFFINMKEAIPRRSLQSSEQVKFYMDKLIKNIDSDYGFLNLINILEIIPMMMFIVIKQFTDGLERTRTAMLLSLELEGRVAAEHGRYSRIGP